MNNPVPITSTYAAARLRLARSVDDRRGLLHNARWKTEVVAEGGRCLVADLARYRGCQGWLAYLCEGAMLEAHRHGEGEPYGERMVVLQGELRDVDRLNHEVYLHTGDSIIHLPNSFHQPTVVSSFAVFLVHRPHGLLPMFDWIK